ncbi:ATP-binding cassette domain-containing protein [Gordonia soli]|uniref:Putative ABC transporter ATP-binding protein n=1 Tax=Gordonia soli NBRC 108243 TaxID=1223545 RepID=M0QG38_9ACTN|nr:ATP-binding cassette domain-containing protein [Gordonia soli]GAC67271.1 putative ABC transporter ATP-binding protein [Gordonia soli NBRC 108243]
MTTTISTPAIEVRGLAKRFGDNVVLDGLDLRVESGEVFALLGPNGSGKTTTVNILSTLMSPDDGAVRICGHDLVDDRRAIRSAIGVTGQFAALDDLLTGRENLFLIAALHHLGRSEQRSRTAELLDRFDLTEAADRPVSTYSGGMRRRLDLAMTLVVTPRLIFLDEPTTGLDPRSRRTLWDMIAALAAEDVTVFLTTQYLEEADRLADRIAVLDHGHLVAEGTAAQLKSSVRGSTVRLTYADSADLVTATRLFDDATVDVDALTQTVPVPDVMDGLRRILDRLDRADITPADLSIQAPTLDDVFFALTDSTTPTTNTPTTSTTTTMKEQP